MGHDIRPIGNHNLNTENIEKLANDIAYQMNLNIEFGYWGRKAHFNLLGENGNDEYVTLGKIVTNPSLKTFKLIDRKYQLKQLFEKFGKDIFYNTDYWHYYYNGKLPEEKMIAEEEMELNFPIYELYLMHSDKYKHLYILKYLYHNQIPYYSRWWAFCRFFVERQFEKEEYLSIMLSYRNELMKHTTSIGGDKIYYLDDQSGVLEGVGQGSEWNMTWNEFEEFVKNKTSHLMLNISLFMSDKTYREHFISKGEYPLSFIDDFADLK